MRNRFMVLLLGASLLAVAAQAGWEYTAVTKAEGGGRKAQMMGNSIKALVAGNQARGEFVESANPMMSAGSYLLMQDAGKTMYMVNPQEKTYSTWDLKAMMGMAGGAMSMMNMQVKEPKVEKLLEEDGGKILGYPTTHYRFRTSYSMEMSFMGMNQSSSVVKEEDIWATTALKEAAFSFQGIGAEMKSGNEQLDRLIAAQKGKVTGFPLKMVHSQSTKDARGQEQVMTTTMESTTR